MYSIHPERNTINWSLRSNEDFDVSAIAKEFGGGGHKNAAGFETKLLPDLGGKSE
jgi:nanoRNase/pAp phosphatase (c-di-AMP/oligoRNAs hydrolase)